MLQLFWNVVLPVLLIVAAGYAYRRAYAVDMVALARFSSQLLSPFLIFAYLAKSPIPADLAGAMALALLLFTAVLAALTVALFRLFRLQALLRPALMTTLFPNTGNYGLPLILFAYGEGAFSLAVFVVVLNFILMYTVGIALAAGRGTSWPATIRQILTLPTTVATGLGLMFGLFHLPLPDALYQPIRLVGDAMVPVALLILGMQLAEARPAAYARATALASAIRLILSPVVMASVVFALGLSPLPAKVLIVQNATSAAVIMTMMAAEYRVQPDYVASVTLVTTLLSFFSLTAVLYAVDLVF
ncbi:MAG: AEC family transporter [Hydrogenibacillus schlegelii]|nr:AEC family transporter [Hydrogenibacillus schlegelii]